MPIFTSEAVHCFWLLRIRSLSDEQKSAKTQSTTHGGMCTRASCLPSQVDVIFWPSATCTHRLVSMKTPADSSIDAPTVKCGAVTATVVTRDWWCVLGATVDCLSDWRWVRQAALDVNRMRAAGHQHRAYNEVCIGVVFKNCDVDLGSLRLTVNEICGKTMSKILVTSLWLFSAMNGAVLVADWLSRMPTRCHIGFIWRTHASWGHNLLHTTNLEHSTTGYGIRPVRWKALRAQ
jgi:hypothetical protein